MGRQTDRWIRRTVYCISIKNILQDKILDIRLKWFKGQGFRTVLAQREIKGSEMGAEGVELRALMYSFFNERQADVTILIQFASVTSAAR